MFDVEKHGDRLTMRYDAPSYRRVIAGEDVILHCHHYNSRLQNTIEGAAEIDGKSIIAGAAEAVFATQLANAFRPGDDEATKWSVAQSLYAHLGYGWFAIDGDEAVARAAHFVEGWNAAFPGRKTPVCTFTEGYLQGAFGAISGKPVWVRERECMITGAEACKFEIVRDRSEALRKHPKSAVPFTAKPVPELPPSAVDSKKIIEALVSMPIHGDSEGLIPAFGVYLASTPADFYNRISIDFITEMTKVGQGKNARKLLVYDAETCGMNTFRGIMSSPEWDGLVGPMIKNEDDKLFGVVAVSNALGWGNWHVTAHRSGTAARLESFNGYEALGYRQYRGKSTVPQCLMLTGVAAGIMELIYSKGSIQDRFGTYMAGEHECISCEHASCVFHVERT